MKKTLEHLAPEIQEEINDIIKYLKEDIEIELIILFGNYAQENFISEYSNKIELLAIIKNEEKAKQKLLSEDIKEKINNRILNKKSWNIIFHGFDYLEEQVNKKSYFFYDVYREGVILFDRKEEIKNVESFTEEQIYMETDKNFKKWVKSSSVFYKLYAYAKSDDNLNESAFLLHQVAERYYTAILLVFGNYKKKTHNLFELNRISCEIDKRFKEVFPNNTEKEKKLFMLLKNAYADARYDMDYSIEIFELKYLEERVQKLRELTEEICKEKIEELKQNLEK